MPPFIPNSSQGTGLKVQGEGSLRPVPLSRDEGVYEEWELSHSSGALPKVKDIALPRNISDLEEQIQ